MNLIHVVDLRVVGGVESMLVNFILATPHVHHHLVLQDRMIHAELKAVLSFVATISSSKHFLGLPLPKKLRTKNRVRIINALNPDTVLVWNQVVDLNNVRASCVYYEHGSAWYEHSLDLIAKCFGQVDKIIAVSFAAKRMLQLKQLVMKPIVVKHNVLFSHLAESKKLARCLPAGRPVIIGSAGRLVSGKCLALLVLVIHELERQGFDVHAEIAGCGNEEDNIKSLIEMYGLQSKVRLLGFVKDMNIFYQNIDIYICPSIHESFGLTCLEAAAYGLPVIAANVDGLPEVVQHNVTGFCLEPVLSIQDYIKETMTLSFFARDVYFPSIDDVGMARVLCPKDIARSIILLLKDSMLYQNMSLCALEYTQNNQKFTDLCQEVLTLCDITNMNDIS